MAPPHGDGILMHEELPETFDQGCGCFQRFNWFSRRRQVYEYDEQSSLITDGERREPWAVKQLKKLKEVSELVAGPKWKTFIRKIGGYFNNKKRKDFQYDSFNYALNFDDGELHDDNEDGRGHGFSTRYAPAVHDKEISPHM